jgi:hypothetical protein
MGTTLSAGRVKRQEFIHGLVQCPQHKNGKLLCDGVHRCSKKRERRIARIASNRR